MAAFAARNVSGAFAAMVSRRARDRAAKSSKAKHSCTSPWPGPGMRPACVPCRTVRRLMPCLSPRRDGACRPSRNPGRAVRPACASARLRWHRSQASARPIPRPCRRPGSAPRSGRETLPAPAVPQRLPGCSAAQPRRHREPDRTLRYQRPRQRPGCLCPAVPAHEGHRPRAVVQRLRQLLPHGQRHCIAPFGVADRQGGDAVGQRLLDMAAAHTTPRCACAASAVP